MSHDPKFIIFTGPMFGSKTTKMLAAIDRYRYQQKKVVAFKPTIDERYDKASIVTHSGGYIPAICVKTGSDIVDHISNLSQKPDIVAIDEAFMIEGIAISLIDLFKSGFTIVVSSLQLSATGNIFEEVRDIMPWATKIEVCPAVCPATGRDAYYTHKKVDNLAEIAIGGADLYEPRCWEMHRYINRRES
jgi:thymidine kinase